MSNDTMAVLAALIGAMIGCTALVATQVLIERRKPQTTPNHARLIAKPHATLDLVDNEGRVVAKVLLQHITYDSREGTSVQFVDYVKYMQRVTFRD